MIRAHAFLKENNSADVNVEITGIAEEIAVEYATITRGIMNAQGGQAILDRAIDLMKKEIDVHEEKRSE